MSVLKNFQILKHFRFQIFILGILKPSLLLVIFPLWLFQIEKLDARGIQLAALFMSGVDTALFANDACGQPVPWEHCCPWIYFDGKLFQSKLIKAGRERVSLVELCDGQVPAHWAATEGHLWSAEWKWMNGQGGEKNWNIGEGWSRSGESVSNLNLTEPTWSQKPIHSLIMYML